VNHPTPADRRTIPPLIVLLGETATGKSALAIRLAGRIGGEILCADSRTVYKGMDIGTAKPSADEMKQVRHYGLDLIKPDEHFSVADFKTYAENIIDEIHSHGSVPIMVGGSGLYIDSVIFNYQFREPADIKLRQELNALSVEELQDRLADLGLELPENSRNPRHLIRTIETGGKTPQHSALRPNTMVLGLSLDRDELRLRITQRVDAMVAAGLVEETERLANTYGWDAESLQAPGYKAIRGYLEGRLSLEEAKAEFIHNDMQLAKRQRTWFRRNKSIHWLLTEDKLAEAVDYATTLLNK
jgi:tRNA dimethylallyltransferase